MTEMKISLLNEFEKCESKAFLSMAGLFKFSKNSTKRFKFAQVLSDILSLYPEVYEENLTNELNSRLEDSMFYNLSEKKQDIELLSKQIQRCINYMREQNYSVCSRKTLRKINFKNCTFTTSIDLIVENPNDNFIRVIRFKAGDPSFTYGYKKIENSPLFSNDLYFLYRAGKELYPDRNIMASIHYLKSKDDTSSFFSPKYEVKKGKNIVEWDYSIENLEFIENKISDIISKEYNLSIQKAKSSSDCLFCQHHDFCYATPSTKTLEKSNKKIHKADGSKLIFSESQKQVIYSYKGNTLVNAGAGSGKTTVIAMRNTTMLISGEKPEDILLITFTNKAQQEMKEKIKYWMNYLEYDFDIEQLNVTTFNSFGMSIILKEKDILGFKNNPRIINTVEKYDIIINLLNEFYIPEFDNRNLFLDLPNAKGSIVVISNLFSEIKSRNFSTPQQLYNEKNKDFLIAKTSIQNLNITESLSLNSCTILLNMYNKYREILISKDFIEYSDQILLPYLLFSRRPDILEKYKFKHVMVDEYQDTDDLQVLLMKQICKNTPNGSLMVVGDDAQSIYGFRHAGKNILTFEKDFENVERIIMTENHRSTQNILTTANILNNYQPEKIDKEIIPAKGSSVGEKPILEICDNINDEYLAIERIIKQELESFSLEDICIIARTSSELIELNTFLNLKNIPSILSIPEKLYSKWQVKNIISLASYLADVTTKSNLIEFLVNILSPTARENMFKLNSEELNNYLLEKEKSLNIPDDDLDKKDYFFSFCYHFYASDKDSVEFINQLESLKFNDIIEISAYLNKFKEYKDKTTVEKKDEKYKAVTLTTSHSSKGKEYPLIITILDKFGEKQNDSTEERRMLYVSLTRAMKKEYIVVNSKFKNGKININNFVYELKNVKIECSNSENTDFFNNRLML